MNRTARTETDVLIAAMQELARTIVSDDGVANAALAEAAERLQEQIVDITALRDALHVSTLDRDGPGHIHFPGDGRGLRDVFVDGELVQDVVFADTRRGTVKVFKRPLQVDERGRIVRETRYGVVEVRFKAGSGKTR